MKILIPNDLIPYCLLSERFGGRFFELFYPFITVFLVVLSFMYFVEYFSTNEATPFSCSFQYAVRITFCTIEHDS